MMKRRLIWAVMAIGALWPAMLMAQDDVDKLMAVNEPVGVSDMVSQNQPEYEGEIFVAVEQPAEFPGGQAALMKWLSNNIRYPEAAQQNDVQGRVIVNFVVEKDGTITQVKVAKGVDKDLDKEAIRVAQKMPKWSPAKNNNIPVRSYYNLPVTFKLQIEEPVTTKLQEGEKVSEEDVDKFVVVKEQVRVRDMESQSQPDHEEDVFVAVEQPAEFPGGQAALMKWLSINLRYPEAAQQNDIQGRVVLTFVVEKDGTITNVRVAKGVDKDLDQEAIRIAQKMPKWSPAKNNNIPVRSYYNLPITFKSPVQK